MAGTTKIQLFCFSRIRLLFHFLTGIKRTEIVFHLKWIFFTIFTPSEAKRKWKNIFNYLKI